MIDNQSTRALLAGRNRVQMVRMLVRRRLEGCLREARAWTTGSVEVRGCRRRRCARYVLLLGKDHRPVCLRKLRKRDVVALRVRRLGRHGGWMQEASESACGESLTNMCIADLPPEFFLSAVGNFAVQPSPCRRPCPCCPCASPNIISSVRGMSTMICPP